VTVSFSSLFYSNKIANTAAPSGIPSVVPDFIPALVVRRTDDPNAPICGTYK